MRFGKAMLAPLVFTLIAAPLALGQGYNVETKSPLTKVVYGGNNQEMPRLDFVYAATGDRSIDILTEGKITISYSGLRITNGAGTGDGTELSLECGDTFATTCDPTGTADPSAVIKNDKDGKGTVVVTLGDTHVTFRVEMVRTDVSSLSVGDKVMASITSADTPDSVPLGGSGQTGSVSGEIAEVANGLKVTATTVTGLSCKSQDLTPTITIAEGFSGAWRDELGTGATPHPKPWIKVAVKNLPVGDEIAWGEDPYEATADIDTNDDGTIDENEEGQIVGTLTAINVSGVTKSDGSVIVFSYSIPDATNTYTDVRSFELTPTLKIANDASLDIHTILVPHAMRNADGNKNIEDLMTNLSFDAPAEYPEEGNGMGWVVVGDCVTYLLYPFVTCGATPGWSTGVSVSNTSADGDVFGAFDDANEQSGSVMLYGFPRGQAAPAEGEMVEPVMSVISPDLMAGDTITFDCSTTALAGMEGYAIIKAGFQHARGMAFVLGNFADGAGVDVSHGYMAEVIDDPTERTDDL